VWIVRNSWGEDWGEDGYVYLTYNSCNIGYVACYVRYGGKAQDDPSCSIKVQKDGENLNSGDVVRPDDTLSFIGTIPSGVTPYTCYFYPEAGGINYKGTYISETESKYGPIMPYINRHGEYEPTLVLSNRLNGNYINTVSTTIIVNQPPYVLSQVDKIRWAGSEGKYKYQPKNDEQARDPDGAGEQLKYQWDYDGDGDDDKTTTNNEFFSNNEYTKIRVRAIDKYGDVGPWSPYPESVERNYFTNNPFIRNIFEKIPTIFQMLNNLLIS
jgi:hypothetical protein